MAKQLAIIRNPGFGMRDMHQPGLWFDVRFGEGSGALQIFHGEEALEVIRKFEVYDVHDLAGRPCWVDVEGMMVKFLGKASL